MSIMQKKAPVGQPLRGLGYRFSARLLLSELLSKQWMEPVIPFFIMVGLAIYFSITLPTYATLINVQSLAQQFSEFGFVSLAMALAILSGGIDLSVAAIFAFTDLAALILLLIWGLPLPMVMVCTLAIGAVLGAFNGFFIGYAKARPFLTTMVTLIIVRAIFNTGRYKGGAVQKADRARCGVSSRRDAPHAQGSGGAALYAGIYQTPVHYGDVRSGDQHASLYGSI